ncbi:MAG TPA: hypothetical protein DC048_02600 [Planctomycetaceae bacterium]|nr:hypothetical protein [Planctomycetaceae bacterium]
MGRGHDLAALATRGGSRDARRRVDRAARDGAAAAGRTPRPRRAGAPPRGTARGRRAGAS